MTAGPEARKNTSASPGRYVEFEANAPIPAEPDISFRLVSLDARPKSKGRGPRGLVSSRWFLRKRPLFEAIGCAIKGGRLRRAGGRLSRSNVLESA